MADRYCSVSGWNIEAVRPTATPDRHDGEWLRVRYLGYYVADCTSVSDVGSGFRWPSSTGMP